MVSFYLKRDEAHKEKVDGHNTPVTETFNEMKHEGKHQEWM